MALNNQQLINIYNNNNIYELICISTEDHKLQTAQRYLSLQYGADFMLMNAQCYHYVDVRP